MRIALLLIVSSAACGYTDGGDGTGTLEVVAEIIYRTHDNDTEVEISVEKDGSTVNDATVELTDGESGETFSVSQANPNETYEASIDSYHRRIKLRVESGADRLEAQLEGPGVHRVVHPENDSILRLAELGSEFEVRWDTEDGLAAQEVIVKIDDDFSHTIRGYQDPGHYGVPTSYLESDDADVSVWRINKVSLNGGIGESRMEIEYRARNSVVVE
jgi:hypothetical protein